MYNSKKLYAFALAIFPHLKDDMRDSLSKAIDFYGMDSGEALLEFYTRHFKTEFLIQFQTDTKI